MTSSSSEVKQLIVVVEGTAALGPYWHTIVSDYLHKILRSFYGSELNAERNKAELSLVVFNSHASYAPCLVQRSGWTSDIDIFSHWLSSIQFSGAGFDEAATAEGLAEALMMFSPPSSQAQPSNGLKRHCLLITASNPHALPTPVYRPPRLQTTQSESRLSDAESAASCFSKCSVSLSVVSPKQLPKIRAIYNAGKRNPQGADFSVDMNKNYLVLISENFVEARAAFCHIVTSLPQIQSTLAPSLPFTGQSSAPMPTSQPKYVKIWEGNLWGKRQGQSVFITNLECYRRDSASDTLAENWPRDMHICRLVSQDHMNNKEYAMKADFLVFRASTQHGFLDQLRDKKLCAVIQLPSQTLLMSVSEKPHRLLGVLLQPDMAEFNPQQLQQQRQQMMLQRLQLQQQQRMLQIQQQQQQRSSPLNQMQQQGGGGGGGDIGFMG